MTITLTDDYGDDHHIAPALKVDGTRSVYYDADGYSTDEARRLAHALLDAADAIDGTFVPIPGGRGKS